MSYDKKILQKSNPYKPIGVKDVVSRTIYYGEVISVDDPTDGGRIKVRVELFDNEILNENLPWSYPLMPKFFHVFPKMGELVRIFIEDIKYPERGRFWFGSVISQPHKIGFDSLYTAQSTTDMALTKPDKAPSTYIDSHGVFPDLDDVALIGRKNTDIILRDNQVELRAGKHEDNDILKLNVKNPASLSLTFEDVDNEYLSRSILISDKIALLSHNGIPKFKAAKIDKEERDRIFEEGHPMVRGDVLFEILNIFRRAIITHVHGYSGLSADKDALIKELEKINIENILQKNIVIN